MIRRAFNRVTQSRMLRASSMVLTGNVIITVLSIIGSIIVGRVMGDYTYGLIIIAMTAVDSVVQFLDVRTQEGLIKFMGGALATGKRRQATTYFYVAISTDVLLTVVALLATLVISPLLVAGNEELALLKSLIAVYWFTIPFSTLNSTFATVLIVYKRYGLHIAHNILKSVVLLFCLALLAGHSVKALMWGYVITSAFGFAISAVLGISLMVRNMETLRGGNYRQAVREFFPFAFHTSFMASLKTVSTHASTLIMGALGLPSEASYYKVGRNATSLMAMPVASLGTVMYPAINDAWAQNDVKRVRYLVKRFMMYAAAVTGSIALLLVITADILIMLTYGKDYAPTANVMRLLAVGFVVESIAAWMRSTVMAAGKPHLVSMSGTISMVVRLAAAVPCIALYGAMGAALAYNIGVLVSVSINAFYVMPRIGLWGGLRRRPARRKHAQGRD
jgi:O-antigen/teichoic acid export membrane protein